MSAHKQSKEYRTVDIMTYNIKSYPNLCRDKMFYRPTSPPHPAEWLTILCDFREARGDFVGELSETDYLTIDMADISVESSKGERKLANDVPAVMNLFKSHVVTFKAQMDKINGKYYADEVRVVDLSTGLVSRPKEQSIADYLAASPTEEGKLYL